MACCYRYKIFIRDEERGCQFVSETDFITLGDDTTWCRFHLPMRDAAGNDSPKAGWDGSKIKQFNQAVFDIIDAAIDAGDEADHAADLSGVVFPGDVKFSRYDKERPFPRVGFRGVVFSETANFREAAFSEYADFREAAFSGPADFSEAAFSRIAYFSEAAFSRKAYFSEAAFSGDAYFGEAAFSGDANFREAAFSGFTYFRAAVFSGTAYFRKAAFSGTTNFSEAAFSGNADFGETVFSGIADFSGAAEAPGGGGRRYDLRLTGTPDEDSAWQAEGEAVLPATPSRSTFQRISFSGATFGGAADFNNRRFTDTTSFRGATFERAPKFHNAVLHQDTDFEEANFRDVRSEDAERNYRTLKLAMETVRSRREEALFFALEQRSLRNQTTTPWMGKFVSGLYDWAAEYGLSFARPLWRILQLFPGFLLSYWVLFGYFSKDQGPPLGRGADIFIFGLQQIFRPFEIWSWRYEIAEPLRTLGIDELPLLIKLAATVETLVTYGLLTLFLLALRKRFRML